MDLLTLHCVTILHVGCLSQQYQTDVPDPIPHEEQVTHNTFLIS